MKNKLNKFILVIPLVLAIVGITFILFKTSAKDEVVITGIVETASVDVASKIAGRVDTVFVKEGMFVQKGQVIALLESKEMDAKVMQTKSLMDAAKAKWDMALHGARSEEKEGAQKLYNQTKHQYELAEKTYKRFSNLYNDGLISSQEKDQVEFQYKAAFEQMSAAKSKYDMALNGARPEEIQGAEALYHQAENGYKEAQAYQQELKVTAPITGEISKKIVNAGEVIASGYPIFTILPTNDNWVTIQLREDLLNNLKINQVVTASIPALKNQKFQFKVVFISPLGDFANWKPTNQKGEFDLKTFEIHLQPVNTIEGLRAGMSVNVNL
ncbi:MAG: efflux RND transporter periplasmic adaptor subunit [Bacteroidota bacterium]|nr:efflux RND transporter periplasmic adaptor subunit [Bacteroidota bacterium]